MAKIFRIVDEYDRGYNERGSHEDIDMLLEKAFKEGCEHGYAKALHSHEYNERGRVHYKEGFEEKIERLKEKYK